MTGLADDEAGHVEAALGRLPLCAFEHLEDLLSCGLWAEPHLEDGVVDGQALDQVGNVLELAGRDGKGAGPCSVERRVGVVLVEGVEPALLGTGDGMTGVKTGRGGDAESTGMEAVLGHLVPPERPPGQLALDRHPALRPRLELGGVPLPSAELVRPLVDERGLVRFSAFLGAEGLVEGPDCFSPHRRVSVGRGEVESLEEDERVRALKVALDPGEPSTRSGQEVEPSPAIWLCPERRFVVEPVELLPRLERALSQDLLGRRLRCERVVGRVVYPLRVPVPRSASLREGSRGRT